MDTKRSSTTASTRPGDIAPYWQVTSSRNSFPFIDRDIKCDTAIIGGGVTGLSIAFELARHRDVVVLEGGAILSGSSGWNAGILSLATTIDLRLVTDHFGEERARSLYRHLSDSAGEVLTALNLGPESWQRGNSLYLAAKAHHRKILKSEMEIRDKFGLTSRMLTRSQLPSWVTGFHGGLLLENENTVHPVLVLSALASEAARRGTRIFESSPVQSVTSGPDGFVLTAGSHRVIARNVVYATGVYGTPFAEMQAISKLLVPVVGSIIVTRPSPEIERIFQSGMVAMWDTYQMLYTYTRYLPDGRILAGGADYPGIARPKVAGVRAAFARELHKVVSERHAFRLPATEYAWHASLSLPADGLPVFRRRTEGSGTVISVSTDGLLSSFLLGKVITDCLVKGSHELEPMLHFDRKLAGSAKLVPMLPRNPALRTLAFRMAFAGLRLNDLLF